MRAISLLCFLPALPRCIALLPTLPRQGTFSSSSWHVDYGQLASRRSFTIETSPWLGSHYDSDGHRGRKCTALNSRTRGTGRKRRRRRRPRHGVVDVEELEDCVLLDRDEIDHQGLAKSIDDEYAIEEAKMGLSFWEVLERERKRKPEDISEKSRSMSPWARAKRRMSYAKGETESKYVLMTPRSYGMPNLLDQDHMTSPPTLDDLNQSPAPFKERYWSTSIFRVSVVAASYYAFPLFLKVFYNFQTIDPEDFDIIVGQIAPNVGVLYATILALTLQVLYDRFTRIQENATTEAMLLSQVTRNLLSLFAKEPEWAIESCQMVANQVRIMLSRTRGVEILSIMKADTYANLLALVDDYHYLHGCDDDFSAQEESVTSMLRGEIGQLMEIRALRLSDEASSLPPTHFTLITSLSFVSIVAYVTASIKVVDDIMHPPQEASLLFAGLFALYFLFFNFCRDLNGPFQGVYQIKRSNAVSHLMQTKWLIVNQMGDSVRFGVNYGEEVQEIEEEKSFLDNIKSLFAGPQPENIAAVEAANMLTLVEELESAVETIGEDGIDDLCDSDLPAAESLDCSEDGRLSRLQQLQDELSRLKQLNYQLTHGEISAGSSDPRERLLNMEAELGRLKQLNQQINGEGTLSDHIIHATTSSAQNTSTESLSAAEAALNQATLDITSIQKALATAATDESRLIESKIMSLTDKATKVSFDAKLEEGLYLIGVGARKKAIINIYAVGMYSSVSTLEALSRVSREEAQMALQSAAGKLDNPASTTSIVLKMVFKADAETIAGAIADSVKPRYVGPVDDVKDLEKLIIDGVISKGGHATKGTMFRFDCTQDGVVVSVDGKMQGIAKHAGMGSAFVDVFMDEKAVSPQLIKSCVDTWCGSNINQEMEKIKAQYDSLSRQLEEARAQKQQAQKAVDDLKTIQIEHETAVKSTLVEANILEDKLLEQASESFKEEEEKRAKEAEEQYAAEVARRKCNAIEAKMVPLKDKSTGVSFDPKLGEGLYLVGVGVRKKTIINVYAVAAYSSPSAIEAISRFQRDKQKKEAQLALKNAARTFDASTPATSFVLEMVFKADAQTIAGAIAESIKPRYGGSASDVKELENLIIEGVKSKGGHATKGTVFRFDCTQEGVGVSVDGKSQGIAKYADMGSAFVDVFMDEKSVSPQLIDSCLNTWCGSDLV